MQFPKPHTFRSKKYLDFIRKHPCSLCGAPGPSHAHHVRMYDGAWGMKPSDLQTMPLCAICHDLTHNGNGPTREEATRIIVKMLSEYIEKGASGDLPGVSGMEV